MQETLVTVGTDEIRHSGVKSKLEPVTSVMQNDLILREVFQYVGLKDLKNFRRVSHAWYDASLSQFREISVAMIDFSNSTSADDDNERSTRRRIILNDILELVNDPDDPLNLTQKPIRNAEFDHYDCFDPSTVRFDGIKFGQMIKSISLGYDYPVTSEKMNFFVENLNEFPNLRELIFTLNIQEMGNHAELVPQQGPWFPPKTSNDKVHLELKQIVISVFAPLVPFNPNLRQSTSWANFLERFPNLNCFKIKWHTADYVESNHENRDCQLIEDILDAIKIIRNKNSDALKIAHLDFDKLLLMNARDPVNLDGIATVFNKLAGLEIPLEHAEFTIGRSHMRLITPFLEAYANSLKTLLISTWDTFYSDMDYNFLLSEPFPATPLSKLTELKTICKDFIFLQSTPNLRKLNVIVGKINGQLMNWSPSATTRINVPFLTDLVCSRFCALDEKDVHMLTQWIPSVKNLTIRLTSKMIPILVNGWPKLTNLTVLGSELTDMGVVGFGYNDGDNKLNICEDRGITGLKYLRSLTFKDHVHLSAIVYSLDRLQHLEHVSFHELDRFCLERIFEGKSRSYSVKYNDPNYW